MVAAVHESACGTKRTSDDVRFSNRPFGVKRFQTIHHHSVDVARGLVLLFGIGKGPSIMGFEDGVEQSFGRPYRQSNGRSKRTCELTSSIVPRGTSSTARWNSSFLLSGLILNGFHAAAAAACSNRPFWVKRFQTLHHHSVDVASLIARFGSSAFS